MTIKEHEAFKNCKGELLFSIIGGSRLYGLELPDSDYDERGIFLATDKKYITGFDTIESIVQTGDVDSTYYELARYLKLLRKSNTQVMEILFSPESSIVHNTEIFKYLRENRYSLIDTHALKASLKGYVYSEIKLATGVRTGELGGKRKASLEKYGYSPKNMVQLLRLCLVGNRFFTNGEYVVKVKDFDEDYHNLLMNIKTNPEKFTCDQLSKMVDDEFVKLCQVMDESKITYKFNVELASDIVSSARDHYNNMDLSWN
jgi:predicted nucleotidyltransferase